MKEANLKLKTVIAKLSPNFLENNKIDGIDINLSALNEDFIYQKTDGKIVNYFPENLSLKISKTGVVELLGLMVNVVSTYLYNIRKKTGVNADIVSKVKMSANSEYELTVTVDKHFFRKKGKGRHKLYFTIYKNVADFGLIEVIQIPFKKSDVYLLMQTIKEIIQSNKISLLTFVEANLLRVDEEKFSRNIISKQMIPINYFDGYFGVGGDVWLHGQELLNLMYVIDKLLYSMYIEKKLSSLQQNFRQVTTINIDDILYLHILRFQVVDEKTIIEPSKFNEMDIKYEIPFSSNLLGLMYVAIDPRMLITSENSAIKKRKELGFVAMRESRFFIDLKSTSSEKNNKEEITLRGEVYVDEMSDEEHSGLIEHYDEEKKRVFVPLMQNFDIKLKNQWWKMIKSLSFALTNEYTDYRNKNKVKFFTINSDISGRFRYDFYLYADPDNKAPLVLNILQWKIKKGKTPYLVGKYRQPLFEKYIYELLVLILNSYRHLKTAKYIVKVGKKDILPYKYSTINNVNIIKRNTAIDFGIKKEDGNVYIGMLNNGFVSKLTEQDKTQLRASAYSRIIRGYWIPFTGEMIAINPDGYFSFLYGELYLEEKEEGVTWATHFLRGVL